MAGASIHSETEASNPIAARNSGKKTKGEIARMKPVISPINSAALVTAAAFLRSPRLSAFATRLLTTSGTPLVIKVSKAR